MRVRRLSQRLSDHWDAHKGWIVGAGIVAILYALPKLGDGLKALVYLTRTPEVAYAAKEKSDMVEQELNDYLKAQRVALQEQRKYTDALNKVLEQRPHPPTEARTPPEMPRVEPDPDNPDLWQWVQQGIRWCSDGRVPWKWTPTHGCQR